MRDSLQELAGTTVAPRAIVGVLAASGVVLLAFWLRPRPMDGLAARVPGTDKGPEAARPDDVSGPEHGELVKSDGVPAEDLPGAWPQLRGPSRDGVCRDPTRLAREWGPEGPPVLWSVELGEGHAGAAVFKGRVYVLDYDRPKQADALRCLSLADGREIWRYSYPVRVKRNHGMSRTVPAVTEKFVVALGPKCHVTCLDSMTGEFLWSMDLARDFGTRVPPWYTGQCPLIEGDRVILAPGGDALMIAVDCRSGSVVWKTPNPLGWTMTHSSVMPVEVGGRRMYLYSASGGLVGVWSRDGRALFQTDTWRIRIATVPSPVPIGDGRVFLSGGYNAGSMMMRLRDEGGEIVTEPLFRLKAKAFGSEQHTPVFHAGHVYGVRPDGRLACLDLEGNVLWTSPNERRFKRGHGSWIVADNMIYVMDSQGTLTLAEATSDGYRELARAKVLQGHDSWGPMALAGGRLIVRDLTTMVCLDVRQR